MRARQMIGINALEQAHEYAKKRIPISVIVNLLEIDAQMHYRTAYDIIKADLAGHTTATRPEWLQAMPNVQTAPTDTRLIDGLTEAGVWREL